MQADRRRPGFYSERPAAPDLSDKRNDTLTSDIWLSLVPKLVYSVITECKLCVRVKCAELNGAVSESCCLPPLPKPVKIQKNLPKLIFTSPKRKKKPNVCLFEIYSNLQC